MKYRIEFTDVADMEIQDIILDLIGLNPRFAGKWQAGIEKAIQSLEVNPGRYPPISESDYLRRDIRKMVYEKYLILYTVLPVLPDQGPTVRILHVRHGSRLPLYNDRSEDNE